MDTYVISSELYKWLGLWLGVFISIYLIYYGYRYQFSKQPLEKQLYLVYLPMFRMLEPYLYKDTKDIGINKLRDISNELTEIIEKHYELINCTVIHWIRLFKRTVDKSDFNYQEITEKFVRLCELIDNEFEATRRKMFLPTRDIYYRLNNNQYSAKIKLNLYFTLTLIPPLAAIIAMTYIVAA